jgi:hypothetical protein
MLGDMPRRKVVAYAPNDVAVQYTLRGGGLGDAWFDLYVYPATLDIGAEAREVESQLIQNLKAQTIEAPAPPPSAASDGTSGWYKGTYGARSMTTAYFLVRRGSWYLKVRASSPDEAGSSGIERLVLAIGQIDWAWNPAASIAALVGRPRQLTLLDGSHPSTHIGYQVRPSPAPME